MDGINIEGLLIGISTFLIIGLFHPVVIKDDYYWGTRCWWIFLLLGIAGIIFSLMVESITLSAIIGVFSFSSFWSIKEIFEQESECRKGGSPKIRREKKHRQKTGNRRLPFAATRLQHESDYSKSYDEKGT